MASNDKSFYWRMEGALAALNKVKKNGYDETIKEMKQRNVLKADLSISKEHYEKWWEELSKNMYANMFTCVCYTLNRHFRFGQTKLCEFKNLFDEETKKCMDLDYMGEHYIKISDYANELNKKYKLDLDINRICENEISADEKNPSYRDTKLYDGIAAMLHANGYEDAAQFMLDKKELDFDKIKNIA